MEDPPSGQAILRMMANPSDQCQIVCRLLQVRSAAKDGEVRWNFHWVSWLKQQKHDRAYKTRLHARKSAEEARKDAKIAAENAIKEAERKLCEAEENTERTVRETD